MPNYDPTQDYWDNPKKIYLRGKYKHLFVLVDYENYEWLNQFKWYFHNLGYASNGRMGYMHRLIIDNPEGYETDHINHNKLDNRKCNLRSVTRSENQRNKGIQHNNTSGVSGVRWDKQRDRWKVSFNIDKKIINVGYFKNKISAIKARNQYERT
jgi:hypothetical protein